MARDPESFLYFVFDGRLVKVGIARDVRRRMGALRTSAPHGLVLIGACRGDAHLEWIVHQELASLRAGREWFRTGPRLTEVVRRRTVVIECAQVGGMLGRSDTELRRHETRKSLELVIGVETPSYHLCDVERLALMLDGGRGERFARVRAAFPTFVESMKAARNMKRQETRAANRLEARNPNRPME
jgi:hypothetical protein